MNVIIFVGIMLLAFASSHVLEKILLRDCEEFIRKCKNDGKPLSFAQLMELNDEFEKKFEKH